MARHRVYAIFEVTYDTGWCCNTRGFYTLKDADKFAAQCPCKIVRRQTMVYSRTEAKRRAGPPPKDLLQKSRQH